MSSGKFMGLAAMAALAYVSSAEVVLAADGGWSLVSGVSYLEYKYEGTGIPINYGSNTIKLFPYNIESNSPLNVRMVGDTDAEKNKDVSLFFPTNWKTPRSTTLDLGTHQLYLGGKNSIDSFTSSSDQRKRNFNNNRRCRFRVTLERFSLRNETWGGDKNSSFRG